MEGNGIEVTVKAPSRLHFGIVDMRGDLGRLHGSVGVATEEPTLILRATKSDKVTFEGFRVKRLEEYAAKVFEVLGVEGGANFRLETDIPEHYGFGSGTQLALSVGAAVTRLYGVEMDTMKLAQKLGRSRRSGVGTHAFMRGGFIVDGGRPVDRPDMVPPLIFRADVPSEWRFVIGLPHIKERVSGEKESQAFRRLGPPPASLVAEVSHVVLLQMIPAVIEADVEAFGKAMTGMDSMFGDYWIQVQGGRYGHPRIEQGIDYLLGHGAYGAGQSSWGPAYYGLAENEAQARELNEGLQELLDGSGGGDSFYTRPDNDGAEITVTGG
ncbi:GHMP kinase [Candidatus Bathyarchaeota archaeon]|nr:GHMP kinase [Candidatus Bathyarchaeota archaeon]